MKITRQQSTHHSYNTFLNRVGNKNLTKKIYIDINYITIH